MPSDKPASASLESSRLVEGSAIPADERLARAIYVALETADQKAFIGEFSTTNRVTVDGKFDLLALARVLRKLI